MDTSLDINESAPNISVPSYARIAAYDNLLSAPRIVDVPPMAVNDYIGTMASKTYELSQGLGGSVPYTVIEELVENFIHAGFEEPVISIYDKGNTIMFSDQGPGIAEKEKAQLPGYTSATREMKRYIRGVGSGLPIVREFLSVTGGSLTIEDNINTGAAITISLQHPSQEQQVVTHKPAHAPVSLPAIQKQNERLALSEREEKIIQLFATYDELGQTDVKRLLNISVGTSSRAFEALEQAGLIQSTSSRKRVLTDKGVRYVFGNADKRVSAQ